jgi:hypothetical protein
VTRERGWTIRALARIADAVVQLGLWVGAYYAYRLVRGVMDGQTAVAFEHARGIVEFERGTGLFFEPGLQNWVSNHMAWLMDVTSWCYVNLHVWGTALFILWLYFRRRESFPFVRNMFLISMGLALVGYLVFPTAPPRYLPEWGFTDTVSNFVGSHAASAATVFYNPYAAVPSVHVAFALMVGFSGARLTPIRFLRPLWYFYPVLVVIAVIVTANHFWLDAALGALVAAMSYSGATYLLARARPEVWSWRSRVPAEAEAAA